MFFFRANLYDHLVQTVGTSHFFFLNIPAFTQCFREKVIEHMLQQSVDLVCTFIDLVHIVYQPFRFKHIDHHIDRLYTDVQFNRSTREKKHTQPADKQSVF